MDCQPQGATICLKTHKLRYLRNGKLVYLKNGSSGQPVNVGKVSWAEKCEKSRLMVCLQSLFRVGNQLEVKPERCQSKPQLCSPTFTTTVCRSRVNFPPILHKSQFSYGYIIGLSSHVSSTLVTHVNVVVLITLNGGCGQIGAGI